MKRETYEGQHVEEITNLILWFMFGAPLIVLLVKVSIWFWKWVWFLKLW